MKPNTNLLFAEERKQKILQMLKTDSKLLVADLSEHFGVSATTIRTDLRELEGDGKLRRTHGGAISVPKTIFEPTSTQKSSKNAVQKEAIAKKAAELVQNGDTILIDSGTTTERIIPFLTKKEQLVVVVNDITLAHALEEYTNAQVIMIGGVIKRGFHCTSGSIAINSIKNLNVEKAFIAANALSVEKALTTPDINQAELKKAMISTATEVFVLCDSSKFGKISFAQFAELNDIDVLITDSGVSDSFQKDLYAQNRNLKIILS